MKKTLAILLLALPAFSALAQFEAAEVPTEKQTQPGQLLAEFDVARDGRPVILPVQLGGKTWRFLVDTGSSNNTFDEALRPLLGSPKETMRVEAEDGTVREVHSYYAPDAKVGPLTMQVGGPVFCIDLANVREVVGLDIRGVIGMGMLAHYVVQFDFAGGKLRFLQPGAKAPQAWGPAVELTTAGVGVPMCTGQFPTSVGDLDVPFVIDTGYGHTGTIRTTTFERLEADGKIPAVAPTLMGSSSGTFSSLVGRVAAFKLAGHTYKGLVFDKSQEMSLLGRGFLARHTATFDFADLKLYLAPNAAAGQPDEADMSGLHLLKKPEGVAVQAVDDDSPAAKAGLKAGDLLIRLAGKPVEQMTLADLRSQLKSGDGRTLELIIRRAGKDYKTSLTLKKRL